MTFNIQSDDGLTTIQLGDPTQVAMNTQVNKKIVVAPGMTPIVIELGVQPEYVDVNGYLSSYDTFRQLMDLVKDDSRHPLWCQLTDGSKWIVGQSGQYEKVVVASLKSRMRAGIIQYSMSIIKLGEFRSA